MKPQPIHDEQTAHQDLALPGGCPLCGGDLSLRIGEGGGAASYCSTCHWVSRPHVRTENGSVTVIHPAGGIA